MIIKLDHISFSCRKSQISSLPPAAGYELQFCESSLKNLRCKESFFQQPQPDHDIYLYERKGGLPVEITAYETCFSGTDSLAFKDDTVTVYSPEPYKTAEFLMMFGLKKNQDIDNGLILIGRFVIGGPLTVRVSQADSAEWKLDKTGWSSLGFLSNDSQRELARLSAAGYETTDTEELIVNQKLMNIGFCSGPYGEIIEIISIKRSNTK